MSVKLTAARDADFCQHRVSAGHRPRVNGVEFDTIKADELLARIAEFVDCGLSHVVHFFAAHPTVEARKNAHYRDLLNRGDLNLPDGLPVVWALRTFGERAQRICGSDGFASLCQAGVPLGLRHYLYGGTPDVLRRLGGELELRYPGIQIAGSEAPPFRPPQEDELRSAAERVRDAKTDLLWIGLGAPKQDLIAERFRDFDCAPVILCVGAAFDFLSGVKRRCPRWMQRTGTEWLFRLLSEPRRLWRRYLLGNPRFLAGVLTDLARSRLSPAGLPNPRNAGPRLRR